MGLGYRFMPEEEGLLHREGNHSGRRGEEEGRRWPARVKVADNS
jgi:hypothetical protein